MTKYRVSLDAMRDALANNPDVTAEVTDSGPGGLKVDLTIRPRNSSRVFVTSVVFRVRDVWEV